MITYKKLRWGNVFSYGPKNELDLCANQLTQLVGKNGHGKTSIGLILEEVQFNTNSKGTKRAKVLNRYSKDKNYWIELEFDKDGVSYLIKTVRTTSSGVVYLYRNGEDISSHTATATYKNIEQILGYDHKTFSQIVYQGSTSALEFLTATDSARKKFLIDLLNLSHYTTIGDTFKSLTTSITKQLDIVQAKVNTTAAWIGKYEKTDLAPKELLPVPEQPTVQRVEVETIQEQLTGLVHTNKQISTNNTYKKILEDLGVPVNSVIKPSNTELNSLRVQLGGLEQELKEGKSLSTKVNGPTKTCPTCNSILDNSTMFSMLQDFEKSKNTLEQKIQELRKSISEQESLVREWDKAQAKVAEWEKYHALFNVNLTSELLDEKTLQNRLTVLKAEIADISAKIKSVTDINNTAIAHNSKVSVISAQMKDMKAELAEYSKELLRLTQESSDYQILTKAFSNTGLVAYKIECLVKDLEDITNIYLAELAGGRFQLSFKITSSDKLNVVITDNGSDIDITDLSMGERARVNCATLLAIRKLMQSLSGSRTNLLILDETVENLDAEGKELLIEVLLKEDTLNTFLISHGFSHPLLEKLSIVKTNNISRIE